MDICTLFSNLITNAFEAAEKSKDKKVHMEIRMVNDEYYIKIVNSYFKKSLDKNSFFETEKGDKENHGIGIGNIKRIIKKYDGILDYEIEAEEITTKVLLNFNQ